MLLEMPSRDGGDANIAEGVGLAFAEGRDAFARHQPTQHA
jgi:hypothetical protein